MFAAAVTTGLALQLASVPPAPRAPERPPIEVTSHVFMAGGARAEASGWRAVFAAGVRADLLFLRARPGSFGVGPFLAVRSDAFADVAPAAGASLLLPVSETFPVVLSAGGVVRVDAAGAAAGVVARAWWGARSLNHESVYTLSAGLWVEGRRFADAAGTLDVVGGVDVDLEIVALPWLALYTWIFRRDPGR